MLIFLFCLRTLSQTTLTENPKAPKFEGGEKVRITGCKNISGKG